MILNLIKSMAKKLSCASILGAQGILMPENSALLEAAHATFNEPAVSLQEFFSNLLDMIVETINSWIYIIARYILMFIDFCQVITYRIAGIDSDLEKIVNMPIFRLILNDAVLNVIGAIIVLGLIILVVATIVAIVKSEYKIAVEDKGDSKSAAYKVIGKSCVSLFLMVLTPFILVVVIIFSSVIMSSVNNVLNSNGTSQATIGGTLFMNSAYHANKYRLYAADGKRIPVLLNFDDPYENGKYQFLTSEELHEIYESWNGEEIYNDFANQNFLPFNETVVYKNGKLYNSYNYQDYERFVATAEQYNVMADFVDYAMSHEIKFYIKDSRDNQIDWDRTSSEIKISEGVYDPYNHTLSITYTDVSDLVPYAEQYTITFETGTASADTPIEAAVATISLILGLNTLVTSSTTKEILSASSVLNNSTLISSAKEVEDILSSVALEASSNSSLEFRLLERVQGSQNLVRWQTEKAIYGGKEYTVYELKKIVKNTINGASDVRATLKVAKKDDSLDTRYYVLKEEKNDYGYYEYTNIEIDYYNNGGLFLDTLTPIFKKATWPEKLYNDLMVIYKDIDFDNYIAYDNWADELGSYFKTDAGVSSSDVATFATTLIHPLGLIMGELFLGLAIEDESGDVGGYSFTSIYLEDIIESLAISITNQYDYKNTVYQIENFSKLFNNQFVSVIESLRRIEGFDVYGTDELSVQCYVYKAYLASIMLSTDYGKYLYDISYELLTGQKLIELMQIKSNSLIYDANGNVLYKIERVKLENGDYIPLMYNDLATSKAVYIQKDNLGNGELVYTVNGSGMVNFNDVKNYILNNAVDESAIKDLLKYELFVPRKGVDFTLETQLVSNKTILDNVMKNPDAFPSLQEGVTSLTFYSVYSEQTRTYIPAYKLYFGTMEEYSAYVDEQVAAGVVEEDIAEWFGTYFSTYYEYDNLNGNIYVYEPTDDDTSKQLTTVKRIRMATIQQGLLAGYAEEDLGVAYFDYTLKHIEEDQEVKDFNDTYFIYEVESVKDSMATYLTYDKLPAIYQNYFNKIIEKIEKDVEKGAFSEPFYLQFLKEYVSNPAEMVDVMNVATINKSTANAYKNSYKQFLIDIEYYQNAIATSSDEKEITKYQKKLDNLIEKVYKMKKYFIINGIESYISTQVSNSFTVIVNSHAYNVSQGMSQRELLETILGNRLVYETLLRKLKNGTTYSNLGVFDQQSFDQLSAFATFYNNELKGIIGSDINSSSLFKGRLSEVEVEILRSLYGIMNGEYLTFTNQDLNAITDINEKTKIYNSIKKVTKNIDYILDNYKTGKTITSGLDGSFTIDTAYALLYEIINIAVGDEELFYVDDDYEGLIGDDLTAFSYLRTFLKDFGDLCFNISRKSNLSNVGKADDYDLTEYIDSFINVLNTQIQNVNLGTSVDMLTIVDGIDDIKGSNYIAGHGNTTYIAGGNSKISVLTAQSKDYFYILYDYYESLIKKYEAELNSHIDAIEYTERFIKGRYAMQSDSFIFETGIKEYLNWFRYNADPTNNNSEAVENFIENYVYTGYKGYDGENLETTELNISADERINYYNAYLEAFTDASIGKNGVYFEALSALQQRVVEDMLDYYRSQYNEFIENPDSEIELHRSCYEVLGRFVSNSITLSEKIFEGDPTKSSITPHSIFLANLDIINTNNLMDYVGLEFEIGKTLNEYRLDAINFLISFKERSGESGASIQARYLTLLYIACSDYVEDAIGNTTIQISSATKNTITDLAGLKDMPEEQLVGLEFEVTRDDVDSIADERFGSVFIICTYNAETNLYEPFVFATGADNKGTPRTTYYSSPTGAIQYYPVVAKGVIDDSGLPTAIREVNGYIEFYRDNVEIKDPGELNLEMYYLSLEEVAINYNPVNLIVNGVTKLLTGKTAAEHMLEAFPSIVNTSQYNFCYGVGESTAWHLDRGGFELNYMFYSDSSIAMNCLYDVAKLNGLVLMLGTIILAYALVRAMFGVIGNLYELAIIILIYPGVFALYPLMEDVQKNWRKQLIDKLLIMLSFILAINGFFIILNLLQRFDITLKLSDESLSVLENTFVFGLFDVSGIIGNLMQLAMFLVAAVLLKTLPEFFTKLLNTGKKDVVDKGEKMQKTIKSNVQEATYLSSGYAVADTISAKMDAMRNLPMVGSEARAVSKEKKQAKANAAMVKNYAKTLKNNGISDAVAAKAVKAYETSLNRQLEAERERRNASKEARINRINKHKERVKYTEPKKDTNVTCPKCKAVFVKKKKPGKCTYCGTSLKK